MNLLKQPQPIMRRRSRLYGLASLASAALFLSPAFPAAAQDPWRLRTAISAPENLTITGSYRVRYEYLDGPFRAANQGSDQVLVERLLLSAEYDFGSAYIGAELQDSRAQLDDQGTPIGTDDVNPAELLRAYIGYRAQDAFVAGDQLDVLAGRITIDAGSRRLVSRNNFRNTINGFTGAHARWTGPDGGKAQAFYTMPVERRPKDVTSLRSSHIEFDKENPHVRFWGALYSKSALIGAATGELYVYGLNEDDRTELATANRNLYTPGFRIYRSPETGKADFEIETALQAGHSRASSAAAAPKLDHFARFHHGEIGYTADNRWKTRIALRYDYASGDKDPADGDNNRFDTLYGSRGFDFGPTGIYGAFARSNISTPGVQLEAEPATGVSAEIGWRAVFLASKRDAWVGAGVADASGASGAFIGNQIEASIRYDIVPGNVRLETGGAYLIDDEFLKEAPNAAGNGDTFYFYSQVALTF